jgi:hypothetical protein
MPPMTPTDWINLGQFGLNAITGLTGGKADERTAQRQQQQDELFRQLQRYNTQLAARSALGTFYTQANRDRALGRQSLLDASPLGAEQALAMQMARARGLSGVAETFQPLMPASADIAGLIRPSSDVLSAFTTPDYRASISPEATARSIAERRKALAGVDPTFQFGSMGDYGLPNLEKEVATYAQGVAADRLGRENLVLDLLNQQMKAASAFGQTTPDGMSMQGVPPTQSSAAQPKKTSWWKKVVGTALPIAAAFIPGVGPAASVALQAAAGAAGGALTGGKKGALTGAITGAIGAKTGGLGSAAGQRAATESAKEFTKRAILQPSTLTSTAGKLIGGQTGTVLQAAAPFFGSIKPYGGTATPTATPIKPIGLGGVTQPVVGMNVPTPTGAETLGGFRRAGNLFEGTPSVSAVATAPAAASPPPPTATTPAARGFWTPVPGADYRRNPSLPMTAAPGGGVRASSSGFEAAKVGGVPGTPDVGINSTLIGKPFWERPVPSAVASAGRTARNAADVLFGGVFSGYTGAPVNAAPQQVPQQPAASKMQTLVRNIAGQQGIDPNVLMAMAGQESAFNPAAVSSKGAMGLLQVMPETAADVLGIPSQYRTPDLMQGLAKRLQTEPDLNATVSAQYFNQLLQQFKDQQLAVAAYNAGPGRIQQVLSGQATLPAETQDYVAKIFGRLNRPVDWSKFGMTPPGTR